MSSRICVAVGSEYTTSAQRKRRVSGTDEQRPQLQRVIGMVEKGSGGRGSCTPDEKPLIDSNIFDFNIHMPP